MKKITLAMAISAISFTVAAQTQLCPTSMKRSNGNGVCGGQGQLTLNYASCPTTPYIIDSVYIDGIKRDVTFAAPSACSGPQHSVNYCFTSGASVLPPSGLWKIYFHDLTVNGARFCVVPDGGPLPINLAGFFTKRSGSNVLLTWNTTYEQNASGFEIQRSLNGKDWGTVGFIAATNKATGNAYSYSDPFNSKSTVQYRLKLVDLDGSFKFSEIRSVKGTGALADFTVFPNPSSGAAKVSINDITEGTEVLVLDNAGRVIKTLPLNNTNNVMINGLQKGLYMIKIVNKLTGETTTKKLTVLN